MKLNWAVAILVCSHLLLRAQEVASPSEAGIRYGQNAAAGSFATVNGIRLSYETYGQGPAMLQIHGNGDSILGMRHQIPFFAAHYKVIVADSRGHGKSELGEGRLTYEQMAEDLDALLSKLAVEGADVLGWSDGGILGLLLAIHHPEKVRKLAIMGANLEPAGAYDWGLAWASHQEKTINDMLAQGDTSQPWRQLKQHMDLLLNQPHIPLSDLHRITAPVLVMAGDKDVIRTEHTVTIFENLPRAQLCIFPGATHLIPRQDAARFNQAVERFFSQPFTRPDTKDSFK